MSTKIKLDISNIKKFVETVRDFPSDVDIISGKTVLDAKSLLAIYSLDVSKPLEVKIISDNKEEIRKFDAKMEEFVW